MTDTTAGRFEHLRAALLDRSLCPACGAPLAGPRCLWCGVPLDGAAAAEVLRLSIAAAEALAVREVGVRALYTERDAALGLPPVRTAPPGRPLPPVPASRPTPRPAAGGTSSRPAGAPAAASRAPRPASSPPAPRWRVQSVLQVLGAGLLSAAGVVFLVFSWDVLDLEVRAVLVAAGTVVVFATASLLARRGLRQGAEAVGAVAAVLLLLDAWALRRTDVVGLGEPGVYASCAALVCAVLLAVWGRSARLRVGTVAAAVLLMLTPLPLASVHPSPVAVAWALLGSVVTSWVRHSPAMLGATADERAVRTSRTVLSVGAALAWPVAALLALSQLGADPDDALPLLAVAGTVAALHGLLARTRPAGPEVVPELCWRAAAAATGLLAATLCAGLTAVGNGAAAVLVLSGLGAALVVVADRRFTPATGRTPVAPTFWHAAVDDPTTSLAPAAALLVATGVGTLLAGRHATVTVLLALAVAAGALDRRRPAGAPAGATTAAARGTLVAAVLVALVGARTSPLAAAVTLAAWAGASVLGRRWGPGRAWAAASTGIAAPWAVAAIGLLAHAAGATDGDAMAIAGAAGAALLALVVVAPDRPRSERTVALTAGAASAGLAWALTALVPHWGDRASLLAVTATCLLVLLALTAGDDRVDRPVAVAAAAAAAPVLTLAVLSAAAVLHPAHGTTGVVLLGAATGTAAVLLAVVARDRRSAAAGRAAALGGWAALGGTLLGASLASPELTATVLLMAAAAALGAGVRDRRPALRWTALALTTASSWTLLGTTHPGTPEAFTAPTAVVVAVVGARRLRRARPEGLLLLGSGLALTLLPTALLRGSLLLPFGLQVDRRLLTTIAATVLTLTAAHRPPRRADGVTTLLAGLGLALTVLGPLRASVDAAHASATSALPELLAVLAAVLLLVCCRSVNDAGPAPLARRVRLAEPWAVTAATVLPSVLAAAPDAAGRVRVCALAAVGLTLTLAGTGPAGRGTDPWRRHLMGVGILVSTAATICVARALPAAPGGAAPALLGLLLMTTLLVRLPRLDQPADAVRAASALALLVPWLAVRAEPWRPAVWLGTAAALVVAAWGVRHRPGSTPAVRLAAGAAAGVALLGPFWSAVVPLLHGGRSAPPAPELWTLPAAVVVAAACLVSWSRRDGLPTRLTLALPALVTAAVPSLLAARATAPGVARLVTVLVVGSTVAVVGQERRFDARRPAAVDDARSTIAAGVAIAAAATLTATVTGPWPRDLPVLVLGILLTGLGVRRARRDPVVSSWRAVGPGLLCAVVVPAAVSTADPAGWRPVVVILLALAATVAGAGRRWQAPFVLGAATLVVVTAVQVGPWAGRVLVRTQGWVLLASCGALLLVLGLRYERRIAQAREAVRFVTAMR